jgi:hypothetical protein
MSLQGTLASALGPSTLFTSTAAVTAIFTPPAAGLGNVAQVALAPAASGSCTGVFTSPSFVAYAPSLPLTLPATDGAQIICALFADTAGNFNTASTAQASITLDTHAPTVGAITVHGSLADGTPSTSTTTTPAVTLDLSASSDATSGLAQMKVSNLSNLSDATWQPYQRSVAWALTSGDANKTVYALFLDAAGNLSGSSAQGSITLDTTGPASASLTVPAYSNSQTVALTLSADGTAVRATVSENATLAGGQSYPRARARCSPASTMRPATPARW